MHDIRETGTNADIEREMNNMGRMNNGKKLERTGRENEQKQVRDSAVSSVDTYNTTQL